MPAENLEDIAYAYARDQRQHSRADQSLEWILDRIARGDRLADLQAMGRGIKRAIEEDD
jgi:hypothetical protein